jgi:type IV conjugative transfer system protein TraE
MNPSFQNSIANLDASNSRSWKWAFAAMSFIAVSLIALIGFIVFNQPFLMMPNGEGKPYQLSRSGANKEYLSDLAYDWMGWWGNITPDNIAYIDERLLKMVDSVGYADIKAQLNDTKQRVKAQQISTIWQPREMEVDAKANQVVAMGSLRTYLGNTLTSEVSKKFQIIFRINTQGRAYVKSFKELEANK